MIELPSWAVAAVEVLYYAIAVPAWALLAVLLALAVVGSIGTPIRAAIFGRLLGDRGESLHPIMRLMVGLIGLGVLWSFAVLWL